MDNHIALIIAAIIAITVLEATAIVTNHDGAYLMPVVGVIGALVGGGVGYTLGTGKETQGNATTTPTKTTGDIPPPEEEA